MPEHTPSNLRVTPLNNSHRALHARLAPFAGWQMPIQYEKGILAEHRHTRARASLFDTCHMAEFRISGPNAATLLDSVFARGTADQKPGICRYNFLLSEQGTILDDLIVYRLADNEFFVVGNAGTRERDGATIRERVGNDLQVVDVSDQTGKLDLQGPESKAVLASLGLPKEEQPQRFRCKSVSLEGREILVSGTGYTGEAGFEIYLPAEDAEALWLRLLNCEAVKPAGLGARDTLRLEAGLPLYGHDLDDSVTPLEAGFDWVLRPRERRFVGCEVLNSTPSRHLIGFQLESRRAAREGDSIFSPDGIAIGTVTSGSFGPTVGVAIGLGYVEGGTPPKTDAECLVGRSQKRSLPGRIAELPFYRSGASKS
ncbi:MAG: glycine cleavage system aminomethyltransferase GcvT [bacterium]